MIGRRITKRNLYLIYSDDLYSWDGGQSILQPEYPWEFVQIGNCGSPIRTRRLLAAADTRGWSGPEIIRLGPFSSTSRTPQRFSHVRVSLWFVRAHRTRGLCTQRRLYLRRDASRATRSSLPYAVSDTFSKFRNHQNRGADGDRRELMGASQC